jgi:acyl-ACP thioesterase
MVELMKKYLHHKKEITVSVSALDFKARLKPGAALEYFQDIATEHADILGIGFDHMTQSGLGWVMLRMSAEFPKISVNPKVGDVLFIETFPQKPNAADVNRVYTIANTVGEIIARASTKWCVVDINTHRIRRCKPVFEQFAELDFLPDFDLINANPKLEKAAEFAQIPENDSIVQTVRVTDLDYNRHMNNARYCDAIVNVCGMEMSEKSRIKRIDINFISQLFAGDSFEVRKLHLHKDGAVLIESVKSNTDETVFRARAEWENMA